MTNNYYEQFAEDFIKNTISVDMSELYKPFLVNLPEGALILDAGCGSGRDSLAFKKLGYKVTSIDASETMARFATKIVGDEVYCLSFKNINFEKTFDGIWACASLLHVPKNELVSILKKLSNALKINGIMYMSFKYGFTERNSCDGRFFLDLDEKLSTELITQIDILSIHSIWVTEDKRSDKKDSKWINILVTRNQ
ncbi:class I SAM-dependent methyltransferase [Thorsellia kenyensis]|uniref:Class I SAM-dependent methyltransferase n=1 Tax=Thorsellia kenyensis TaxID=1549888 RepID=A0ABV6CG30_9GAMM